MSANTSEAGPSTTATANGTTAEARPLEQLGALEEDDEFEEFPVEDWDESQTTLAVLTKQAQQQTSGAGNQNGAGSSGTDVGAQLWEDNWDDDDKEPPFVQQLRAELKSQNDADAMKL